MKKVILVLCVLAILLCCIGCGKKSTAGLVFDAVDGYYVVTDYTGTDVHVVIPDEYNNVPVAGIEEEAFYGSDVQTIDLGKNIRFIGEEAFCEASMLKSIQLPAALEELGEACFYSCVSLESVVFEGNKLEQLEPYVFAECRQLKEIELPQSVKEIGSGCFEECTGLMNVIIPEGLVKLGNHSFGGCISIKKLEIPSAEIHIGARAFRDWTSKQVIYISADVISGDANWNGSCEARITSHR